MLTLEYKFSVTDSPCSKFSQYMHKLSRVFHCSVGYSPSSIDPSCLPSRVFKSSPVWKEKQMLYVALYSHYSPWQPGMCKSWTSGSPRSSKMWENRDGSYMHKFFAAAQKTMGLGSYVYNFMYMHIKPMLIRLKSTFEIAAYSLTLWCNLSEVVAQSVSVVFNYLYFWQKKWLSYTFEAFYMSVTALEGQTILNEHCRPDRNRPPTWG